MDRREFIQRAGAGVTYLALPTMPELGKALRMGVVVHSYASRWNAKVTSANYPGFATALDLLEHCHQIGAGGVQVVVNNWTADFARNLRDRREKLGMYLEGSVSLPKNAGEVPAFEQNVLRAKEAGAGVLRTVCSGGRRYEIFRSAEEFTNLRKTSLASLRLAEPVLRKQGLKLGIENHKDWRAAELVSILNELDSGWLGVTLDFGNNLALLEDPAEVVQTLAPYVFSTHVKDMAVEDYADGFRLSEVPLGQGLLDLPALVALCRKHNPDVTFNLEMITRDPLEIPCLKPDYWATFGNVPATDLARTLRLVRQRKPDALPRVSQLSAEDRLAAEEQNIVACLAYSQDRLALK